jgi:RND family efflux transporter MFP subunit
MPEARVHFWRPGRVVFAVALIVVALIAAATLRNPFTDRAATDIDVAPSGARAAVLTVTTVKLAPTELARELTVNGSVFAWQDVIIGPEVGGYRVADVYVDVGDEVKRGQELVELSTALLRAEVATKRAILSQRQAEFGNADSALRRGESLAAMNVLSEADLDRLKAEALAAQAGVASAQADLETSSLRLNFTTVLAPDDGIVTSRTVTVGEMAQAGSELLRLMRKGRIEWRGEIPEARLAELQVGQSVTVSTPDGEVFAGSIRIVAPTISTTNRTGLVYVDLPSDERLRPGMFARGQVEIGRGPALMVSLESLVSADGYSYVFVLRADNTVERRRIETGTVDNARIEVTSGLKAGEMIVAKGAGFLRDGDLVNVAAEIGS